MSMQTELTRRAFLEASATLIGGAMLPQVLPAAAADRPAPVAVPSTLVPTQAILKRIVEQYARREDDPWALMHGIRAMGRDFTIKGESAVDFLCSRYLKRQTIGGKGYLYIPLDQEGHTNALLKTILEAGVSPSHPFRLEGRRYTVGDLASGARARFTFDPKTMRDDIAWTLIAFSLQIPPSQESWTTAAGQRVAFSDIIRFGFDTLDGATRQLRADRALGRMPEAKDIVQDLTCGGTHLLYGLASCVGNGHRGHDFPRRLTEHLDLHVWRLEADGHLMEQFFRAAAPPPGQEKGWEKLTTLYHNDSKIKFYGHSFEILSYVKRKRLFSPTPEQRRVIDKAAGTLARAAEGISKVDLLEVRRINRRLFHLLIGDVCHAYHGIHMVPGVNQI